MQAPITLLLFKFLKNSIADARTLQPGEIAYNTTYLKVHIIISCSNPYVFVIRETCQTWQVSTLLKVTHNDAHLQTLTNVPTKGPLSTPYRIQEMAGTRVQTHGHCDKVRVQINFTL